MGNNACSKGPIRRDVRQFLPPTWDDLLLLERWAASRNVHFIRDKATLVEWFGPKRRQEVLDAVDSRKDYFSFPVCVNDFLAGFALVQHAPVLRKFEFISRLANTGGSCSKPELLIAMYFGVRGIAKLKGSKLPQDKALRYIASNVFDARQAMDWTIVIQKLIAVPDVVYFLCDLDMVLVESLETLIADQLHGMKELAAIEYEIGVAECAAMSETAIIASETSLDDHEPLQPVVDLLSLSTTRTTSAQTKRVQLHNVDKCCRRIHLAFKPPVDGNSTRSLTMESCLRLDAGGLQELVASATDNVVALSDLEAAHQVDQFSKDQLERVSCSDVIRWFKQWVAMHNRETPPKWQVAATQCVDLCRSAGSWWGQFVTTMRDTLSKTAPAPQSPDKHDAFDLDAPQESNYSFLVHIETPSPALPVASATAEVPEERATLAVRLEFNERATDVAPTSAKTANQDPTLDILDQMQLDEEEVLETGFPMACTVEFMLWKAVTDESAALLARVVGQFLNDYVVLEAMSFLWQKANVSIVYGYRDHAVKLIPDTASDKYYLRITFLTRRSLFADFESALRTDLPALIQTLHLELQLKNSLEELVAYSRAAVQRLLSLHQEPKDDTSSHDSLQSLLFKRMDTNGDGELSLDEVNGFQQVMGQSVLESPSHYHHLITSNSLPHNSQTGNLTPHGLDVYFSKFGGLQAACHTLRIGCLNEIIQGTISVVASFNRRALSKLASYLTSCSPYHNVWPKWAFLSALQLTDVSTELSFPTLLDCVQYFWPRLGVPLLDVPGWLGFVLTDVQALFSTDHNHVGHASCVNLLCAIRMSLQRYQAQAPDNAKAKGAADPTLALTMQAIEKFQEACQEWERSVCGVQQGVLSNRDVEFRVEFDHFVWPSPLRPPTSTPTHGA